MKKSFLIITILYLFGPVIVNAASFSLAGSNFKGVIYEILSIIGLVLPILYSLCFIAFFWGLSRFVLNPGNATEIKNGRTYMIWGVTALFVLISIRVIVGIIARDLEIGDPNKGIPIIPTASNPSGTDSSTFSLPTGIP